MITRRAVLLGGVGLLLAGCAQGQRAVRSLPGPAWDARPAPRADQTVEAPATPPATATTARFGRVLPRTQWAKGAPIPSRMRPMLPVKYITVHHDGMRPFYGYDAKAAALRLDAIRRSHQRNGWGDIGYHFAIDRAGNIWEGRPLTHQGAHVKYHNEHNIGVVCLGNFDQQQPTEAQLAALYRHVEVLMRAYKVPVERLKTHQEWSPTACPGRNLQRCMLAARAAGRFG